MGIVKGPVVPIEGVVSTHTGCAKELSIDKTESENRVNNLLFFILFVFLILEEVDVAMSGCFR